MIQFVITVLIVIVLMYIFRKKNRFIRQNWAKLQRFLVGYDIQTKGKADLEAKLLIINHQSLLDIVALEDLHPKNLCWVAKKEIEKIPLFGHIIHAPHMISVEREDKSSLLKLLKNAKDRVKKGRVIAIFPEGTRGDGKKLLEFKIGAKFLAQKLNLKVQPVVVSGSKAVLDSQTMQAHSGKITVHFLPSFNPNENKSWYQDMHTDMQRVLSHELSNNSSHR